MALGRLLGAVGAGVALASLGLTTLAGQQPAVDGSRVDFNAHVRPLLSDRCFRCHGPDAGKRKAKLRLDTRDGLLKDLGDGQAVVTPSCGRSVHEARFDPRPQSPGDSLFRRRQVTMLP